VLPNREKRSGWLGAGYLLSLRPLRPLPPTASPPSSPFTEPPIPRRNPTNPSPLPHWGLVPPLVYAY